MDDGDTSLIEWSRRYEIGRKELAAPGKADETWINADHVVAVTPDPGDRFMVVVLDVVGARFGRGPKVYKISFENGQELLRA